MKQREYERGPLTIVVDEEASKETGLFNAMAFGDFTMQVFGCGKSPEEAEQDLIKNLGIAQSKIMKSLRTK